jgi:hypothetical protein
VVISKESVKFRMQADDIPSPYIPDLDIHPPRHRSRPPHLHRQRKNPPPTKTRRPNRHRHLVSFHITYRQSINQSSLLKQSSPS